MSWYLPRTSFSLLLTTANPHVFRQRLDRGQPELPSPLFCECGLWYVLVFFSFFPQLLLNSPNSSASSALYPSVSLSPPFPLHRYLQFDYYDIYPITEHTPTIDRLTNNFYLFVLRPSHTLLHRHSGSHGYCLSWGCQDSQSPASRAPAKTASRIPGLAQQFEELAAVSPPSKHLCLSSCSYCCARAVELENNTCNSMFVGWSICKSMASSPSPSLLSLVSSNFKPETGGRPTQ